MDRNSQVFGFFHKVHASFRTAGTVRNFTSLDFQVTSWMPRSHAPAMILVHLWEKTNQRSTFAIFRFSILEISSVCKIFSKNMLVRHRGIDNKGVLETLDKMEGFEGHFWYIEMSVYRKMLKSGLSDTMYHQIG